VGTQYPEAKMDIADGYISRMLIEESYSNLQMTDASD